MNTILLITVMSTLALVHAVNNSPCQKNPNNNAYNTFVTRHILQESFDKTSVDAWKSYLSSKNLCKNRPLQSFMEQADVVEQICNGKGHKVKDNLCMSDSTILVHDLKVQDDCTVTILPPENKKVIVACDKVDNQCRPVHFEKYTNQKPTTEVCRP